MRRLQKRLILYSLLFSIFKIVYTQTNIFCQSNLVKYYEKIYESQSSSLAAFKQVLTCLYIKSPNKTKKKLSNIFINSYYIHYNLILPLMSFQPGIIKQQKIGGFVCLRHPYNILFEMKVQNKHKKKNMYKNWFHIRTGEINSSNNLYIKK